MAAPPTRKMSGVGAAMASVPWPDSMNMFEPYVTACLWFDELPSRESMVRAFETHLWASHRFNSCIENGNWVKRHDKMDADYHVVDKSVADDTEIDKFTMEIQLTKLSVDYPRWKVFRLAAARGRSAVMIHVHHAIGDGLGLLFAMSPTMSVADGSPVLSKVPLPKSVLPRSVREEMQRNEAAAKSKQEDIPASQRQSFQDNLQDPLITQAAQEADEEEQARPSIWKRYDMGITTAIRSWTKGAFTPLMTSQDTELTINEPLARRNPVLTYSGKRELTRLPPIPMSAIKAVRTRHKCSMNDVVMAAVVGCLRKYAMEVKDDQVLKNGTPVDCKTLMMIALPRPIDDRDLTTALCNKILFATLQLPIDEASPKQRIRKSIAGCNNLKSKAYMSGLVGFTNFITKIAPQSLLNKAAGETWSKHTLCVTNVPATSVPATWPADGGQEIKSISVCIANVMSQISMVSYNGCVYASLVADPDLMPDPKKLGEMWEEEFGILAGA